MYCVNVLIKYFVQVHFPLSKNTFKKVYQFTKNKLDNITHCCHNVENTLMCFQNLIHFNKGNERENFFRPGIRETAVGASRSLLRKDAHPQAAALKALGADATAALSLGALLRKNEVKFRVVPRFFAPICVAMHR